MFNIVTIAKNMNYNIIQTHILFENDTIAEIAVLWKDGDLFRATYASSKPISGYLYISKNEQVSIELFQRVAGQGLYLDPERKKRYFPKIKNWSK